jgi:pterin-4a-carbinolamine dehydratase
MKSLLIIIPILIPQSPFVASRDRVSLTQLIGFETLSNRPLHIHAARLTNYQENELHKPILDWQIDRTDVHRLRQLFTFRSYDKLFQFQEAIYRIVDSRFINNVSVFKVDKKILIELYTPDVIGLTENDFILAAKISTLKYLHFPHA